MSRARTRSRAAARKVARRLESRRIAAGTPVLSIVVPSYNVQAYIGECLDSLLGSTLREIEVIVVDDGSTDGTHDIAREYAARDPRVRVFRQTNSGQGIARNLGVEHARGEFLTFIDSDDTVPPQALALMVRTLRRTGSDFVVGSARRVSNDSFRKTAWAHTVHLKDRFGVTIQDFPLAMQDIIACNRVFRTAFWREKVGGFRGHIAYEDHVPMLTAYVRAERFDILARTTYNWRIREDLTSTSQQKASLENLLDRIAVKEEAYELLQAEAPTSVYDTWVARVLEVDFPVFIDHALRGSEMYRNILAATYRTFLGRAAPEAMAEVRQFQKTRAWLVAHERWDDVDEAEAYYREVGMLPPTTVENGRVLAETRPFLEGMPDEVRELNELETRFDGVVESAVWEGDSLTLTGFALIRGVSMTEPPAAEAWLEGPAGERREVALSQVVRPEANTWARNGNAHYDGAGFEVRIDAASLPTPQADEAPWTLHLRIEHEGVVRSGTLHRHIGGGSGANAVALVHQLEGATRTLLPVRDHARGYGVTVRRSPASLVGVRPGKGRTVMGCLAVTGDQAPARIRATQGRRQVAASLVPAGPGLLDFSLTLPGTVATDDWVLQVELADDLIDYPAWALDTPVAPASSALVWERGRRGGVRIRGVDDRLQVIGIDVADEQLRVTVDADGRDVATLSGVRLTSERVELRPAEVTVTGAEATVVLPLTASVMGGRVLPLPPGNYRLTIPGVAGPVAASVDLALQQRMPQRFEQHRLHVRTSIPAEGADLGLSVMPPLTAAENSLAGQRTLRVAYQAITPEPAASVLFGCYRGEFATDSQLALDRALDEAMPDLTRYWGVESLAVEVPEGSVPLVLGSSAWYDALASSTYLCNNIDFEGWFRKRPHQRYLQTFHGYPFKSMGRGFWKGKGYTEERIAREIARRNEEYDAILVPSEMCAELYRQEYDYTGRILVTGYPRSDVLVNADREQVRNRTLGRLGVPPSRQVVLYAPTYRDNLTTRTYAARLFLELDLAELTRRLGDDVVVLLRGHNNNQREKDRIKGLPGVVDVTDYPDINDLTIAADAAILDYSSLRFDWALTGKPMVFFVPDMADYFGQRPPLFRFEDSAPGPWLTTTGEVAEALSDLDALLALQKSDIEAFNATYNQLHDGHASERVIDAFFR